MSYFVQKALCLFDYLFVFVDIIREEFDVPSSSICSSYIIERVQPLCVTAFLQIKTSLLNFDQKALQSVCLFLITPSEKDITWLNLMHHHHHFTQVNWKGVAFVRNCLSADQVCYILFKKPFFLFGCLFLRKLSEKDITWLNLMHLHHHLVKLINSKLIVF